MKSIIYKLSLTFILLVFWNCATIMTGSKQDIGVRSEPEGAKVTITTIGGVQVASGTTPGSYNLKKGKEYIVIVEMEGYQKQEVHLSKAINMYIIGNLLCGGIPGLIVDGLSGALFNIEPEELYVTLQLADIYTGQKELYAVVSWYDDEKQDVVNLPIKMNKLD